MKKEKVLQWRIVMLMKDGTEKDFELQHDETAQIIDELIEQDYLVNWKP